MIAQALIERAQAGVDVRLLYDAIGSQGTSTSLLSMMEAAGVKVHAYHSFLYALREPVLLRDPQPPQSPQAAGG